MKLLCILLFLCMMSCSQNGINHSPENDSSETEEYEWSPEDWSEEEDED